MTFWDFCNARPVLTGFGFFASLALAFVVAYDVGQSIAKAILIRSSAKVLANANGRDGKITVDK